MKIREFIVEPNDDGTWDIEPGWTPVRIEESNKRETGRALRVWAHDNGGHEWVKAMLRAADLYGATVE